MKYARITLDPSQGVNYYEIKFSRLDKQGKSFSRLGAEMWNCIPLCIRKLAKQSFGKKINDCLLQILSQTKDNHDLQGKQGKQGKSFSRLGAEMWNCIPLCIRKLAKQSFGKKINDCLLQILSQTKDYHDLPTLLGQMQHVQNRPQLTHSYIFAIILTVYL